MFPRHKIRHKDGKKHRYWSIVENRRGGPDAGRSTSAFADANHFANSALARHR
jgi:hypothetical protein